MDATLPSQLIQTDQDLVHWLMSDGCRGYQAWIKMLSKKIEGVSFSSAQAHLPPPSQVSLAALSSLCLPPRGCSSLVSHVLTQLHLYVDDPRPRKDALPSQEPDISASSASLRSEVRQPRFQDLLRSDYRGSSHHPFTTASTFYSNLIHHTSISTLQELPSLLTTLLEPTSHLPLLPQLLPLLQNTSAFGSSTRLDYGTGHEAAFFLFLYALRVGGVLKEEDDEWVALRVFRS